MHTRVWRRPHVRARVLQKESLDTVRVDHVFAG
jgi:hypothetical protein